MEVDPMLPISVEWSEQSHAFTNLLGKLYNNEAFADCAIMSEDGSEMMAHKLILSAASPLFEQMLKKDRTRYPLLMLPTVSHADLLALITYIYKGTVELEIEQLKSFLDMAKSLKISGLNDIQMQEESDAVVSPPAEEMPRTPRKPTVVKAYNPTSVITEPIVIPKEEYYDDSAQENKSDDDPFADGSDPEVEIDYLSEEDEDENENADDNCLIGKSLKDDERYTIVHAVDELQNTPQLVDERIERSNIRIRLEADKEKRRQKLLRTNSKNLHIKCHTCGGLYKSENTFKNHLKQDCNRFHGCPNCKKTFKNKRHLLDHVRDDCGRVHQCSFCNKIFKQKVNLTTHLKIYCKTEIYK